MDHAILVVPHCVRTCATDMVLRFRGCVMRPILLGTRARTTESILAWQGARRCAAGRSRRYSFTAIVPPRARLVITREAGRRQAWINAMRGCRPQYNRCCFIHGATDAPAISRVPIVERDGHCTPRRVHQDAIRGWPRRAAQRGLARRALRPTPESPAPTPEQIRPHSTGVRSCWLFQYNITING